MQEYIEKYGAELVTKQLEIEAKYKFLGQEAVRTSYEKAKAEPDGVMRTSLGQKVLGNQFEQIKQGMGVFVETCLNPHCGTKPAYTEIVARIDKLYGEAGRSELLDTLTLITFSACLNASLLRQSPISNICQTINGELLDEVQLQAYINMLPDKKDSIYRGIDKRVQALYRRAYASARMEHDGFVFRVWNKEQGMQLAASLIEVVLKVSNYFEKQTVDSILCVIPTQALLAGWQRNEDRLVERAYKLCPTVLPPRPWENYKDGGYYGELRNTCTLLRIRNQYDVYAKHYMQNLGQLELTNVRKAINAIQATPWRINKAVLGVLQELVKRGGGVAGIPNMAEPIPPSVLPADPTPEQVAAHKIKMIGFYRSETRRKSISLRVLSQLRMADEFKDFERIYFPCNMDFRGRVYPIPSFSFQGDDVAKSLILFADVPPCFTEESYKWFLVEGANLAGVDKVSYHDRCQWVLDNEQQILACANDPLGDLWWAQQDCPCQMLAYCFEYKRLKDWMATHGGSIKGFVTGINVAFDGTCSGLQHFSAMLRDPVGANAVNLMPADKPSDIYGIVAQKVNGQLEKDAKDGTPDEEVEDKQGNYRLKYGTRTLAQRWLQYGVNRKVTKRSVMTLAYGSKEYGFRDQIMEDTINQDINDKGEASVFYDCAGQASAYLAKLIWIAVSATVVKAVEGMKWLQTCAKAVTKNQQVVTWTTPMGLLVQQSYMSVESRVVQVRCAGKRLRIYSRHSTGTIDKHKQASGIAPNFIHSMDASHLQMVACRGTDMGIKHWAMIHDSFGAPVSQAHMLYDIIRDTFIEMYTKFDPLAMFKADMQLLTDKDIPTPPAKGTFDINNVKQSEYIFS